MIRTLILLVIVSLAFTHTAMAHAIRFDVEKHPPVVMVHASFSPTSPIADANVEVYAPDSETPFQTGRTDPAGFFAFVPDQDGDWTVVVDDERGHRDRTVVSISEPFFGEGPGEGPDEEEAEPAPIAPQTPQQATNEIPVIYRIIFGLALIFGLTGIFYGMKARQSHKAI